MKLEYGRSIFIEQFLVYSKDPALPRNIRHVSKGTLNALLFAAPESVGYNLPALYSGL